jgi:cholesterol transport system auxiliary component
MKIVWIIVASFMLSACSLSPVKIPPMAKFTLSPSVVLKPAGRQSNKTLLVSTPVASAGYNTKQMQYMMTPYQLQAFAHNQWVAPPAQMLTPIFAAAIRSQKFYKAVVEPPFSGLTDYNLQTQLMSFDQNFMQPVSRFVMVVQASLVNNATNRVVASRRFKVVMPAPGNNPYAGVLAANKAVAKLSRALSRFALL